MSTAIWSLVIAIAIASIIITYIIKKAGDIAADRRTDAAIREAGEPEKMNEPEASDSSDEDAVT